MHEPRKSATFPFNLSSVSTTWPTAPPNRSQLLVTVDPPSISFFEYTTVIAYTCSDANSDLAITAVVLRSPNMTNSFKRAVEIP